MRILVTGASGFVGKYLVNALRNLEHEVFTDRFDVLNPEACRLALRGMHQVFHLASKVSIKPSDAKLTYATNVDGTKTLMEQAILARVEKFIHVSSVAAIGASDSENGLLNEDSPYLFKGRNFVNFDSKYESEQIVLQAAKTNRVHAVVLNPSMIFGAGDVVKLARKGTMLAAKGTLPFFTFGGISVAPVEDVVQAMITASKVGRSGERYILSGENLSFQSIFQAYADLGQAKAPRSGLNTKLLRSLAWGLHAIKLNTKLTPESAQAATSYHWYDHAKATQELSYEPGSALKAIKRSFQFMKDQGYLK